ncbi:uncharacterized protein [Drosophila bipectinata]|uniref:uncharacterized protein n=1 Tax=Drosophila bipectinata TaxID=42026 RepID=UPI0038B2A29B
MSDEEEDILEGYTSEESDLARALSGIGIEEDSLLSSETEAEVTVVENLMKRGPLRVSSVYFSHDQALPPHPLLKQLVEDSRKHKIDLIIGCDANAHHHQWGSTDTSKRANWELYRKKLESSLGKPPTRDVDSREVLDAMVDTLTAACARAFNKACPKSRSGNNKSKKPSWWSQTLAPFKTKARKAFNFASKINSETAWETYKANLRQYNKELGKAKRNSWTKFCTNIQQTSEAFRLRKVLATTAPNVGYIKTSKGKWTRSSKEILEALTEAHLPGCSLEETTLETRRQGTAPPSVTNSNTY